MPTVEGFRLLRRREIVMPAVVFALFLATSSIMRLEETGLDEAAVTISRLMSIGTMGTVAVLVGGGKRDVPIRRILLLGYIGGAVYLFFLVLQTLGVEIPMFSEALPVWRCTAFFSGLMEGSFLLLCVAMLSALAPRYSAVGVALGCLLSAVLVLLPSVLPVTAEAWLKVLLPAAGMLMTAPAIRSVTEGGLSAPVARLLLEDEGLPKDMPSRRTIDPMIVVSLACSAALLFLSGLDTKLVTTAGIPLGPHNWTYQLAAIAVCAVITLISVKRGLVAAFDTTVLVTAPFFLLAYLLLAVFEGSGYFLMGLLAKAGYTLFQALLWIALVRMTYSNMQEIPLLTALFYGTMRLSALFGRAFADSFSSTDAPLPLSMLTTAALCLICLCCMSLLAGRLRVPREEDTSSRFLADAETNDCISREPGQPSSSFESSLTRFSTHFGLSDREREVASGIVRGHTNTDLATELGVSASTVRTYVQRLYNKTNCLNRKELFAAWDAFRQ